MGDAIRYPNMGTVKKAAEIYGLSPVYIRRLCKEGKIRYVNAGHMWLVNLDIVWQVGSCGSRTRRPGGRVCVDHRAANGLLDLLPCK